jgi:hypothetical protein
MIGLIILIIYYAFMNKETLIPATNNEVLNSLDKLNKGNHRPSSNQLIFDPTTGQFVIAKPNDNLPADATTINSIAQDGFANSSKS